MLNKIKNIFYILLLLGFFSFSIQYYFSDENITSVNKMRALNIEDGNLLLTDLPILKNDTKNIIEFTDDVETFKTLIKNEVKLMNDIFIDNDILLNKLKLLRLMLILDLYVLLPELFPEALSELI